MAGEVGEALSRELERKSEQAKQQFMNQLRREGVTLTYALIFLLKGTGPALKKIYNKIQDEHSVIDLSNKDLDLKDALNKVSDVQLSLGRIREDALVYDNFNIKEMKKMAAACGVKVVISKTFDKDGKPARYISFLGKNKESIEKLRNAMSKRFDFCHINDIDDNKYSQFVDYLDKEGIKVEKILEEELPSYRLANSGISSENINEEKVYENIVRKIEAVIPITEKDKAHIIEHIKKRFSLSPNYETIKRIANEITSVAYLGHGDEVKASRKGIINMCDHCIEHLNKKIQAYKSGEDTVEKSENIRVLMDKMDSIKKLKETVEKMPEDSAFFFNINKLIQSHFLSIDDKLSAIFGSKWHLKSSDIREDYLSRFSKEMNVLTTKETQDMDTPNFLLSLSSKLSNAIADIIKDFSREFSREEGAEIE